MSNKLSRINENSVGALIDSWLNAERDGEMFPVPFDMAWQIAGYSRKDVAKRRLSKLTGGADFHRSVEMVERPQGGGAKQEIFHMTCDAFKHFCLMAETEQGREVRQYFIECEKKWRLVQEVAPVVAGEIDALHLKIQLATIEAQKEQAIAAAKRADVDLIQFRHIVVSTMPEVIQQKVLGYTEVKVVEYRDRIIKDDEVLRDGSTIQKTEMCQRLGLMTKAGKPDFKALNHFLENVALPSEAFELKATIRENLELKREYWPQVQEYWAIAERQRWLGE